MPGCLVPLLVLAVPVFDIWLLFQIGGRFGGLNTLLVMLASMFIGLSLARAQRVLVLGSLKSRLAAGKLPTAAMADAPMLLLAGTLFVLPGFLTDALGLLLLVAPIRRVLFALAARRMLKAAREGRMNVRMFGGVFGAGQQGQGAQPRSGDGSGDDGAARGDGAPARGVFGPPPGAGGAFEASREVKELPPDSYRVRDPDSPS